MSRDPTSAGDKQDAGRTMSARDLFDCVVRLRGKPPFDLTATRSGGKTVAVHETVVARTPFCTLRRFVRVGGEADPAVLVVAPLSGHYATLMRDAMAGLLPDHDVYVTDWHDARDVPQEAGPFGFDDNVGTVIRFMRRLGPETHVLAVCQSAQPALAATALMAASGEAAPPRSLVLMGGLIDPRINPTRIGRLATRLPLARFEAMVMTRVPAGYDGAGRRVYPRHAQRAALLSYLARHLEFRPGIVPEVRVRGDATLADPAFCREFLTVMDLPAELFLENLRIVFKEHALACGTLTCAGRTVVPSAITRTALMTVEGEFDDTSGRGQTRAAHDLCAAIPPERRAHHEEAGVGHFGMYAGRHWRESVLPKVRAFIRAQG